MVHFLLLRRGIAKHKYFFRLIPHHLTPRVLSLGICYTCDVFPECPCAFSYTPHVCHVLVLGKHATFHFRVWTPSQPKISHNNNLWANHHRPLVPLITILELLFLSLSVGVGVVSVSVIPFSFPSGLFFDFLRRDWWVLALEVYIWCGVCDSSCQHRWRTHRRCNTLARLSSGVKFLLLVLPKLIALPFIHFQTTLHQPQQPRQHPHLQQPQQLLQQHQQQVMLLQQLQAQ